MDAKLSLGAGMNCVHTSARMHPNPLAAAQAILRERFGFKSFRPGQEAVIAHLLAGRSALAVFPAAAARASATSCREFAIAPEAHGHTGFYRPNRFLRVTSCAPRDRIDVLFGRLTSRPAGPAIVYVTLQRTAESVAAAVAAAGLSAEAYHAGMAAAKGALAANKIEG